MSVEDLLAGYVDFALRAAPMAATALGVHEHDHLLDDVDPHAIAEVARRRRNFLRRIEAVDPARLDPAQRLDWRVALIDARTAVYREAEVRVWQRAPYWYAESLGRALSAVMSRGFAAVPERAESLRHRLAGVGDYLAAARHNLTSATPALWAEMGVVAARGLATFLAEGVPQFAAQLREAQRNDLVRAAERAASDVDDFAAFVGELHGRARGSFTAGPEHVDFLLAEHHLLDLDSDQLYEFGRESVERDRRAITELAEECQPGVAWPEQIARIKDRHPEPDQFVDTYLHELRRARKHTIEAELATIPPGEECRMGEVPAYLRASLPIAVMNTTAPFEVGLTSEWLITPSDPTAPAERRLQHARDNCYTFAESIAGHEIYPGHHLQKVHHKLGTQGSPIRRYFSSPQFVEGWGLYVEDLFEETGFFDNPAVLLFKRRNALWRSLRVVIDVGIHTGRLDFASAVALLRESAGMDTHMAEGEVKRYTRHDNPTYPSSYLLGRNKIHELRTAWRAQRGQASHREFHDQLLSYGSLPVRLIADQMLTADSG
jgi:uncharacterized protein (DUF885 family)